MTPQDSLELRAGDALIFWDRLVTMASPRSIDEEWETWKASYTANYMHVTFEVGDVLLIIDVKDPIVQVIDRHKKMHVLYLYQLAERARLLT